MIIIYKLHLLVMDCLIGGVFFSNIIIIISCLFADDNYHYYYISDFFSLRLRLKIGIYLSCIHLITSLIMQTPNAHTQLHP